MLIQRLAHVVLGDNEPPTSRLNIERISLHLGKAIQAAEQGGQDATSSAQDIILLDINVFEHMLNQFDGFSLLFQGLTNVRTNVIAVKKNIGERIEKLRGLRLAANQRALAHIVTKFMKIDAGITDALNRVQRSSSTFLTSAAAIQHLDPRFNANLIDK